MKLSRGKPKLGAPNAMQRGEPATEPLVVVARARRRFDQREREERRLAVLAVADREHLARSGSAPASASQRSPSASQPNMPCGGTRVRLHEQLAPVRELARAKRR